MYRNLYGDGCLETANAGLSRLGRRLVREVNDNRILLDLAHVGERTSLEAIEASALPSVISHANPRTLIPNPRNITDDQIRAVARANGVCGVCGWSPILYRESQGSRPPDERDLADSVQYIADLVGIDHVGVGTDSPASGLGTAIAAEHAKEVNAAYPDVTGAYVRNVGERLEDRYGVALWKLPKLTAELARRGFSAQDIGKVMGGNFLRVFAEVWA
jgi:membrane dipeptidase